MLCRVVVAALILVLCTSSVSDSKVRVVTIDDFQKAMIKIGNSFAIINFAVSSSAYLLNSVRGNALSELEIARQNMIGIQDFFMSRAKADAMIFSKNTLTTMDALKKELSEANPSEAAAFEINQMVRDTCSACHNVYRDGDQQTGFQFKVGAL